MKIIAVIITVIVMEACALTWLFSAENSQLSAENDRLKHQISYQKDKIAELNWFIAKMDLLLAGKTAEEIFQSEKQDEPEKQDEAEDDNVIFID